MSAKLLILALAALCGYGATSSFAQSNQSNPVQTVSDQGLKQSDFLGTFQGVWGNAWGTKADIRIDALSGETVIGLYRYNYDSPNGVNDPFNTRLSGRAFAFKGQFATMIWTLVDHDHLDGESHYGSSVSHIHMTRVPPTTSAVPKE